MNIGKNFPDRIEYLMKINGIKNGLALARALYNSGICQCNGLDLKQEISNKSRTIRNHIQGKTVPDLNDLKMYCDFFKCSSDFLLGLIDYPEHDKTVISSLTGLSMDAVTNLITYRLNGMNTGFIDMLSDITTDKKKRNAMWLMYDALEEYKD